MSINLKTTTAAIIISECLSLDFLALPHVILIATQEVDTVIIPMLQTRNLRLREVKSLAQDHTARKQKSGNSDAGLPVARAHSIDQYAFLLPSSLGPNLIFYLHKFVYLMLATLEDKIAENSNSVCVCVLDGIYTFVLHVFSMTKEMTTVVRLS